MRVDAQSKLNMMKMEKYSKIINDAIKRIDWNVVQAFYENRDFVVNQKGKIHYNTRSVDDIKKDLRELINIAIDNNSKETRQDQWIICWEEDIDTDSYKLEVLFVASKCNIEEVGTIMLGDDDIDGIEKDVLEDMLKKSIEEENYELSQVIHSRLKKINKKVIKKR